MVSSIPYLVVSPCGSAVSRDFSTRAVTWASTSPAGGAPAACGPPDTASAAASVNPPANTARRRHSVRSGGVSKSQLQSVSARSVRCRGRTARGPPDSSVNRSSSRPAISCGVSARTRAAASSMASGMPSSRRQISLTAAAFPAVSAKPGRACAARSANSRTASAPAASATARPASSAGSPSEGTSQQTSPSAPSGSRLVASTRSSGAARSSVRISPAAAASTCSQLSMISSRSRSAR